MNHITRYVFVAFIFTVTAPCFALDNDELAQRTANWEGYFYPGVKAMEERNLTKAEELFRQALREIEPLGDTAAAASTLSSLCNVYQLQGNLKRAHVMCNNAVAISQRLRGDLHPEVAMDMVPLAQIESKLQNYEQALRLLANAIHIMQKTGNGRKQPTKIMLQMVAHTYEKKGDREAAEKIKKTITEVSWEP